MENAICGSKYVNHQLTGENYYNNMELINSVLHYVCFTFETV